MDLEQNHIEWHNPDPERQISYVLTHKWLLDIKQNNQSTIHNSREPRQQRGP